jgi:predicted DNA-binding transcriptional regulator AlpA
MTPNPIDPAEDVFRTSAEVRHRYGVSDMWIHRRLNDDSGFPQPIVINRRRFWKLSDFLAWERDQAAATRKPRRAVTPVTR